VSRLISRPPAEQTSGATSAADKARRPASLAVDQIRICHQPANGESAWHRGVNPTGVGIDDRVQISAGCSALSCSTSVGKIIIPQLQGGLAETGIRATVPPPDRSRQYPPAQIANRGKDNPSTARVNSNGRHRPYGCSLPSAHAGVPAHHGRPRSFSACCEIILLRRV
jgi:hypothetical protein